MIFIFALVEVATAALDLHESYAAYPHHVAASYLYAATGLMPFMVKWKRQTK